MFEWVMRWDGQQISITEGGALPGLQRMTGLLRSIQTPEFDGVTFHEVLCKSALNKVPAAASVPFRWTINPYRGCSHACAYCLAGDTLILMGDGHVKPIADVRVGDHIYGTSMTDNHRRYVPTTVLDHWRTVKRAFRVKLADGTTIVASGDHRLLTHHGWKHVSAGPAGIVHRPHLIIGDELVGMGSAAATLDASPEYRLGYLVGFARPHADVTSDSQLRITSIQPLDTAIPMFDISTGTGDFVANGVVSHNCFARHSHTYLDLNSGEDFNREVVVKVNLPEVLRRELGKPSWSHEHVAMGTNTDPYQRAEGRYRLMPTVIESLTNSGTPFSVLTKGTLLRRDLPLLAQAATNVDVGVAVSLAVLDDGLQRSLEPGAPSPRARLNLIRAIRNADLSCGVLVAPVLPALTDSLDHLDALISAVIEAGATHVTAMPLHLRPGAREWYLQWLARQRPDLIPTYQRLYRRGAYADQRYGAWLRQRVMPLLRKHHLNRAPYRQRNARFDGEVNNRRTVDPPPQTPAEVTLF
jgi:DNA repair photolyase